MEKYKNIKDNEEKVTENFYKLEEEMKNKKDLPKLEIEKINKKIFQNMIIAILIMLYLYFVNLGSLNIETNIFIMDLKVFSIGLIIFSIILFEYSYKKDNGNICIHGIECTFIALFTMFSMYAYVLFFDKFNLIIASLSFLFGIYYVGKSIAIYLKMKKNYINSLNDISEIIKKK